MNNPTQTVLEFNNLSKFYHRGAPNEIRVLDGASAHLGAGEIAALVAPSGAGKSTLLHIIGLLDDADSGALTIDGISITGTNDRDRTALRRQKLGFVYQMHHLLPEFTAAENIALPQRANGAGAGAAHARALDLLDQVGLKDRAGHRPSTLSGGQQQRVAFCRALANTPRVLLADEPTGNLDPDTSDHVFDVLLKMVRSTGMSALIATHNMDLARKMDQIWTLRGGKIVVGQ